MTIHVYTGLDMRDLNAWDVFCKSLRHWASEEVEITTIREWELRFAGAYRRPYTVNADGQRTDLLTAQPFSTEFSFTRFLVPWMHKEMFQREGLAIWADPDMMWRADVKDLLECWNDEYVVQCVCHKYEPEAGTKMAGLVQTKYPRKLWSSLMIMDPERISLGLAEVNGESGAYLHQFEWLKNSQLGPIPEYWNWVPGHSDPRFDPRLVHYTEGTPDLPDYKNIVDDKDFASEWRGYSNEK